MTGVKKVSHQENVEYVYEDEEIRTEHIKFMTMHDWSVGSRQMRLKDGVHIASATDEDYEWYAEFWRFPK